MNLALGDIIDLFSIKRSERFAGCCCMTGSNALKRGIRGLLLLLKSASAADLFSNSNSCFETRFYTSRSTTTR
jgi:hypothetical protein